MKDGITTAIYTICILGLSLWLFSTLVPWWGETFGPAEENIDAKLQAEKDAKSCASYTPLYINKVLYCQCSDKESQKPGKCNEKYK